jgi:hypothetical protein
MCDVLAYETCTQLHDGVRSGDDDFPFLARNTHPETNYVSGQVTASQGLGLVDKIDLLPAL